MKACFARFKRAGIYLAAIVAIGLGVPAAPAQAQTPSAYDAVKQRGVLRVGWAPWFPYAYKDPKTNQVAGVTADLMQSLAQSLGTKVAFVEDGWGTMIAGLQADKFDVLMPMAVTPPRAEAATFSEEFMKVDLGAMVRKADQDKYATWKDLNKPGVTISVAMGSNTALYARQTFDKANVVEMKGEPEAVTAVITGKSDAWASTYSAFSGSAPGRDRLVVVAGEPFAYNPVALVVRKGDTKMRGAVDTFLEQYRDSGELAKAIGKYGLQQTEILKKN